MITIVIIIPSPCRAGPDEEAAGGLPVGRRLDADAAGLVQGGGSGVDRVPVLEPRLLGPSRSAMPRRAASRPCQCLASDPQGEPLV